MSVNYNFVIKSDGVDKHVTSGVMKPKPLSDKNKS